MDKLSQLIQEAKPLYKRRKMQRTILRSCLILVVPVIITATTVGMYNSGNEIYLSLENNSLQEEILEDDMGFLR